MFKLDYNHHIYGGFQKFVEFFIHRAVNIGIVYFLYYLYPLNQDQADTSQINFKDFGE